MAEFLKNAFGGAKPEAKVANPDSDFADFAEAPSPALQAAPAGATLESAAPDATDVPYTKWYNVHERHSLSEFKMEGIILGIAALIFVFHIIGARANRNKAKKWLAAHQSALKSEFALVGFGGVPHLDNEDNSGPLLKEKSLFEFATYASGRQNTAFLDIKLTLTKKFNPIVNFTEQILGFFVESFTQPKDVMEAFAYTFDGREALTVPSLPGAAEIRSKDAKSTYDGFVWAIVNKDLMQQTRDERYDLSLTFTKDNAKLSNWLTVMSESAEITETLLTQELADAVQSAGDLFDYIIISDQGVDRPSTIDETTPRKRLFLKYRLPSNGSYDSLLPLFSYFLRLPDTLVKVAHFRPEVLRKVKNTRENMIAEIKKAEEEEKNEERLIEKEKLKKAKRDAELKALDAKAQKKYLDKEREKEMRKSQKKQTMRG
ncbi:Fc.00g111160.m01.CDS01 [Cosmosporella sp. VM-42]